MAITAPSAADRAHLGSTLATHEHFGHAHFSQTALDSTVTIHHVVDVGLGMIERFLSKTQSNSNKGQSLFGVRILVVDDYEDARNLVATILEREGAEVVQAESVAEAIEVMSASSFGVLVSDIGMPIEDGYDLIRRVRSNSGAGWAPELPAVAVTAFSTPADREHALAAGFQEHLAKPVDMVALVAAVTRLVTPPPAPHLE